MNSSEGTVTEALKCPDCGKEFKSRLGLAGHRGRMHGKSGGTSTENQSSQPKQVEKAEFSAVQQESVPLEKVPGLGGGAKEPTPPTADQQVQTAGSGFKVLLKGLANRFNDSLSTPPSVIGPEAYKISDSEIEDFSNALEQVLAKYGGDKGAGAFLLKYSAEFSLLVVAAFMLGKVIGGLRAKKAKYQTTENPRTQETIASKISGIFQRQQGEDKEQKELDKAAKAIHEDYWKGVPGG